PGETHSFLDRFEAMRQNRHLSGGSKIRQFGTFEEWHAGNRQMFVNQAEAERYKRRVMDMASGGALSEGGGGGGGGMWGAPTPGGGRGGGLMRGAMRVGGPLAVLAGVAGVAGMVGRGHDQARQEAMSIDLLLRSIGDTSEEFEDLRSQVRRSTDGLGIAFTDMAEMARRFVKEANARPGTDIMGNLRTGAGMGRSFGFDPSVGVGFMAHMRHYGTIGSDDPNGRRMALMIGEAIEEGAVTAKADEVLSAVAGFTTQVARLTLTAPNVAGFAGALSSLTSTKTPGLDPANAANMLMAANAAMTKGGAMGEASQNFTYGMLTREHGAMSPIMAMMVAEQGLFGSPRDLFKTNAKGMMSPLGQMLFEDGARPEDFTDTTNLELAQREIGRMYGFGTVGVNAFMRQFGLQSHSQAAALFRMNPNSVDGFTDLLGRAGVSPNSVNSTAIQNLASIGAAGSMGDLQPHIDRVMGMEGVSKEAKDRIAFAQEAGMLNDVKVELAKVVAERGQEENQGDKVRQAVKDLENKLTDVGGRLVPLTTSIQENVVRIANAIAPREKSTMEIGKDFMQDVLTGIISPGVLAKRLQSRMDGADLPANNPAGGPSNNRSFLDLNLTGTLLDWFGKPGASIDPVQERVQLPSANGTAGTTGSW
ncbi:MAG TPA: hypothetical protein VFX91_12565, partial [Alcanivorax sp.]|nr:hypothetical protein [Alcanivorax sp.]